MGNVATMNMIRHTALAAFLALMGLSSPPATAQITSQDDVLAAQLLPGWRTAGGTHIIALHLEMAEGWKTYWRAPGESGIPPLFNWSGSENLAGVHILWPRPSVFAVNGMNTIGYKRELVLPIELTANNPGAPIHLRANIDLGVCRDICMPVQLDLTLELPDAGAPDRAIAAALHDQPQTSHTAGLSAISCTVTPIADGLRLTAVIDIPTSGGQETTVFELPNSNIWVAEAETRRDGGRLTAVTELVAPAGQPFALNRQGVVVTIIGQDRAVEIRGCPAG